METDTFFPDETFKEILSQLKTYDQIQLCQTNKRIKSLCNTFNIDILNNNLNYKLFAGNDNSVFYIKNNTLYHILRNKKIEAFELPNNDIPVSIIMNGYDLFIITDSNKLYRCFINPYITTPDVRLHKFILITIPGKILSVEGSRAGKRLCYIITTMGLYEYDIDKEVFSNTLLIHLYLLEMVIMDCW